jgi:hypothetical protein
MKFGFLSFSYSHFGSPIARKPRAADHPVARARWRRCFAFSLAFRLLARMALLALAGFLFMLCSDLDRIGAFLTSIFIRGTALTSSVHDI